MKLFYSAASPYARKCRVVAIEKDLDDRIETILAAPMENPPGLRAANPLGKVPALLLEVGTSLFDSPVICEYLDALGDGPALLPPNGPDRWRVRKLEAVGDGIMDAAVAIAMERNTRGDGEKSEKWIERWYDAINAALNLVESDAGNLASEPDLGNISLACALSYLDLRHEALAWRESHPALADWHKAFSARPSMVSTVP